MKLKHIKIDLHDVVLDSYSAVTRDELVTRLDEALAKIPEQDRASASFEIEKWEEYDSIYAELRINYTRDETDAELANRRAVDKANTESRKTRELAEYARLQKKFGAST